MRALLPSSQTPPDAAGEDFDLHAHYAADWAEQGGLRVNFVASIDGAISVAGRSRGLQTPGDNRVFSALRDLADVVLVGSRTAQAEGYRARHVSPERAAIRRAYAVNADLPIAVVSRSLKLDPTSSLFAPDAPHTLVLTCAAADPSARAALEPVADVVICGEDEVDIATARTALKQRGHTRILCEGGPHLFSELLAAGAVDELCLSVSPLLAGPGIGRITAGPAIESAPIRAELVGLLEEDGAMFCRYRIPRA